MSKETKVRVSSLRKPMNETLEEVMVEEGVTKEAQIEVKD